MSNLPPEVVAYLPVVFFILFVVGLAYTAIRLVNRRLPVNTEGSGLYGTPKWTREPDEPVVAVARVPSIYDDDLTEVVVREPAIYTDRDPTVQVNVRRDEPKPWEWAK